MMLQNVEFLSSFTREDDCPRDHRPEFAFIGRSNVGKSSLINMLCDRKDLAKTSKQPGKTQLINFFDVDQSWYLVDLPGYGYAKISQKMRAKWEKMIHYYLRVRETLQCAFVLLDARHPLQEIDRSFLAWCGENSVPIVLVLTKIDKVRTTEREAHIARIKDDILEDWTELPPLFVTSAEKGEGREDILEFIEELVNNF